eukprot:TRINITY_DN45953_c0_g1_i1.p1 TRINITY_DN45953_c0_g1~~TRINITY_DN45953_c0_g1_i1.p1  ORF type:complete len:240 (+),score=12.30 TRINITY_DN45953_c0_g1_i1:36-755(+)
MLRCTCRQLCSINQLIRGTGLQIAQAGKHLREADFLKMPQPGDKFLQLYVRKFCYREKSTFDVPWHKEAAEDENRMFEAFRRWQQHQFKCHPGVALLKLDVHRFEVHPQSELVKTKLRKIPLWEYCTPWGTKFKLSAGPKAKSTEQLILMWDALFQHGMLADWQPEDLDDMAVGPEFPLVLADKEPFAEMPTLGKIQRPKGYDPSAIEKGSRHPRINNQLYVHHDGIRDVGFEFPKRRR